jgi:hypothetical protein
VITIWGIDSSIRANQVVGKQLVYDLVCNLTKRTPAFWGRYIIGGVNQTLTRAEAALLHDKGCRILPISSCTATEVAGDYKAGRGSAERAKGAARGLGIPRRVFIYADIEQPFKPSVKWLTGWWDGMRESEYGGYGGLYCENSPVNAWFNKPYQAALKEYRATYAAVDQKVFLWAQSPHTSCNTAPAWPDEHVGDGVRLWQYATDCYNAILPPVNGHKIGLCDMNLAINEGFEHMWAPPAEHHAVVPTQRAVRPSPVPFSDPNPPADLGTPARAGTGVRDGSDDQVFTDGKGG